MRLLWTIFFAVFCVVAHAEIPPIGAGHIHVDRSMPNDVYDTLLNEIEKKNHLTVADDCNMAGSILVYRAGSPQPLQLVDKSGNNRYWGFKLNTRSLVRNAQTAISDLNAKVDASGKRYWSDVVENTMAGVASPDGGLQQIYTDRWEYWKTIDQMTDEESVAIRQMESAYGTTLMFGPYRGVLTFVDSTFYKGDPNGDKIQIRVGKAPHFSLNAEHSETSIVFDLPKGLIGQLKELGDGGIILVRWTGYFSLPEDWQSSSNADPEMFKQELKEETAFFRAKNIKAAVNSLLTGSCMYNYVEAIAD